MSFLMLMLQSAAAVPPSPGLARIDFDLATYRASGLASDLAGSVTRPHCDRAGDAATIVVCARRPGGAYPMAEMARLFAERPLTASVRVFGNGTLGIQGESAGLDRGAVSNRVLVRLRVPF
jgi:hypothetical protein